MENIKILLKEFKKNILTERQWIVKIDVRDIWTKWSDVFDDDYTDEDFKNFKAEIIPKLKTYIDKVNTKLGEDAAIEYENYIEELEIADNLDDFNYNWEDLYNFADIESIWIGTF